MGTSTTPDFTDTGLLPGTSYAYKVQAFDTSDNPSLFSDVLTTATTKDVTPPTKPGNIKASSITQTTMTLSWGASTDNVGVVKYYIYKNGVKIGESTTLSIPVTGLVKNTSYTFTVAALDVSGNMSVLSNPLTVKTAN